MTVDKTLSDIWRNYLDGFAILERQGVRRIVEGSTAVRVEVFFIPKDRVVRSLYKSFEAADEAEALRTLEEVVISSTDLTRVPAPAIGPVEAARYILRKVVEEALPGVMLNVIDVVFSGLNEGAPPEYRVHWRTEDMPYNGGPIYARADTPWEAGLRLVEQLKGSLANREAAKEKEAAREARNAEIQSQREENAIPLAEYTEDVLFHHGEYQSDLESWLDDRAFDLPPDASLDDEDATFYFEEAVSVSLKDELLRKAPEIAESFIEGCELEEDCAYYLEPLVVDALTKGAETVDPERGWYTEGPRCVAYTWHDLVRRRDER